MARLHEQFNGVTFFRALSIIPDNHINMGAEASKAGYGATFGLGDTGGVVKIRHEHEAGGGAKQTQMLQLQAQMKRDIGQKQPGNSIIANGAGSKVPKTGAADRSNVRGSGRNGNICSPPT